MSKKILLPCMVLCISVAVALICAQTVYAVATSASIPIGKSLPSVKTGDTIVFTVGIQNATKTDDLTTPLPAILLTGAVISEFNTCGTPNCLTDVLPPEIPTSTELQNLFDSETGICLAEIRSCLFGKPDGLENLKRRFVFTRDERAGFEFQNKGKNNGIKLG